MGLSEKIMALRPVIRGSQCHYERQELTVRSFRVSYLTRYLWLPRFLLAHKKGDVYYVPIFP